MYRKTLRGLRCCICRATGLRRQIFRVQLRLYADDATVPVLAKVGDGGQFLLAFLGLETLVVVHDLFFIQSFAHLKGMW